MRLAVLLLDEVRFLSEHLGGGLAVQRQVHLAGPARAGKLHLHVEQRAGQDVGAVDRVDGLGAGGEGGACEQGGQQQAQDNPHGFLTVNRRCVTLSGERDGVIAARGVPDHVLRPGRPIPP